jgi:FkbM family methyltransferase
MNIAKLVWLAGKLPVIGVCLRWYARQFHEGSIVTIAHGYAVGYLWKRSHRYVNGYWLGQYELPIQQALVREVKAGMTFFDVGANAGFFTLVAARLVGTSGKVVAFEPEPVSAQYIREQLSINHLGYCHVAEEAIGDQVRTAPFAFSAPGSSMAHLGNAAKNEQCIQVKLGTLDNAVESWGKPDFIKMDIEGAEAKALQGAGRLLDQHRPIWLIELHGQECAVQVHEILQKYGYTFYNLESKKIDCETVFPSHILAKFSGQ